MKSCKTCKHKNKKSTDWPCTDCNSESRYENEDTDKCHPYERPYRSDEREYY